MPRLDRVPHKISLGPGFLIEVVFLNHRDLVEVYDADDDEHVDGVWSSELGNGLDVCGRILIWKRLSLKSKWKVLRHELIHALNDIMAYDHDRPLST